MRPNTEFRFQNATLSLANFDGVGRPIQNAALSLAHFSKPNSEICELRGLRNCATIACNAGPKTEFRFQNAALSLARFDGVGRPIQNAALSLAHFSKPNCDICELRGAPASHTRAGL